MKIKELFTAAAFCAASVLALSSCSKKEEAAAAPTVASQEALSQIKALGFGTEDVRPVAGGFVVEGDMLLTNAMLASAPGYSTLRVGDEEQYRTTNLVGGLPRTLTVSLSTQFPAAYGPAIDEAILRYNAANLQLHFTRITSGTADLPVNYSADLGPGVLGQSGGFPSGGNPAPGFTLVPSVINSTVTNYIATIMAHEMGHCIGMRHTDYYNRQYSCGGRKSNEGASTVGAILIPGTPSLAEPNSWMLACVGNGVDRPFTANDLTALQYIYEPQLVFQTNSPGSYEPGLFVWHYPFYSTSLTTGPAPRRANRLGLFTVSPPELPGRPALSFAPAAGTRLGADHWYQAR